MIHSKSGGHKTFCIKIESLQFPLFMLRVACLCLSVSTALPLHTARDLTLYLPLAEDISFLVVSLVPQHW